MSDNGYWVFAYSSPSALPGVVADIPEWDGTYREYEVQDVESAAHRVAVSLAGERSEVERSSRNPQRFYVLRDGICVMTLAAIRCDRDSGKQIN